MALAISTAGAQAQSAATQGESTDLSVETTGTPSGDSGDPLQFLLRVRNLGPTTAIGVVVSDTLPPRSRFVRASGGGFEAAPGVVTWTLSDLAPGAESTFLLELIAPGVGGPDPVEVTNVAVVSSTTSDPNLSNNVSRFTTIVEGRAPDVSTVKVGPAVVSGGEEFLYTVTVTTTAPGVDALNVVVTDTLPENGNLVGFTGVGSVENRVITWETIPALRDGEVRVFEVTYRAPGGPDTLRNVGAAATTSADSDLSNNRSVVFTEVLALEPVRLTIDKVGPDSVLVGDTAKYTITIRNADSRAATRVQVRDTLPTIGRAIFVRASGGIIPDLPDGRVVSWPEIPRLDPGESAVFTVTVRLFAGCHINTADVTAAEAGSAVDRAMTCTIAPGPAFVNIEKTGPDTAFVGDTFEYAIRTWTSGTSALQQVVVTDSLPPSFTFVGATNGGTESGGVVRWGPRDLVVGDTVVDQLTVVAKSAGQYTNISWISSPTVSERDTATTLVLQRDPDVALTKTTVADFSVGVAGEFQFTVNNVGGGPTNGPVTLVDTLPAGLTYASGGDVGWVVTAQGPLVMAVFADTLYPGESTVFTITVDVGAAARPCFANSATISTAGDLPTGPNGANNTAAVTGCPPGELFLRKVASQAVAEIGDLVDYVLTVGVADDGAVDSVTVVDRLPTGFRYQAGSARINDDSVPDPQVSPGPALTFNGIDIPIGDSVRIAYRLLVGPGADLGDGINRARASSPHVPDAPDARAKVEVRRGPFSDEGIILGKVFVDCACDPLEQTDGENGIPGVRIYLQDGSSVVTDSEGKYSFYGMSPRTWIVKVDRSTLPAGARLNPLTNAHANDGSSAFVNLKRGELHRADFADASPSSLAEVERRRQQAARDGVLRFPAEGGLSERSRVDGQNSASVFRPVLPDYVLTDRNTGLPAAPGVLEVPEGGGLRQAAAQPLTQPQSDALGIMIEGGVRADGTTPVPVTISPADSVAGIVTLEASASYWMEDVSNGGTGAGDSLVLAWDLVPEQPGLQVGIEAAGTTYYLIAPPVPSVVEVRVSLDQQRTRSESVAFGPVLRPLVAAGLLEARLDLRSLTDTQLGLGRDRFEDALRTFRIDSDDGDVTAGARAALFLKGGLDLDQDNEAETELTLRLDSEIDERARLFRDIQPDQFYSVYGDAGLREYDAQSKGRFYGQLQRGASFLTYGDFNTGLGNYGQTGARALGQYTRTLNGAREHFESEYASIDAFASRDRFSQIVDEMPGQGVSGPYALSRTDGLVGSERVELVTRDRNQPAVVLRSQVLERFTDYTIEPFSGRIIFKMPIQSVDSEFNPVSIRIAYEVEADGGEEFWVFGANGQFRPLERLEIGGGFVRDDNPLSRFDLASVNATFELVPGSTYLIGEYARTDSASLNSGDAGRLELRHSSRRFDGRLFYLGTDRAFNNPSSALSSGREELGFRGVGLLAERTQLFGEFLRTEDRFTGGVRKGGRIALEQAWGRWVRAQLGYRMAEETASAATPGSSEEPIDVNAVGVRVTAGLPFLPEGSVFGEFEQDVSNSEQRRALVGGDYRILSRARIYGRHEFLSSLSGPYGLTPGAEQNNTIFGIAADYLAGQSVFSEYRAKDAFQGRDAQAAIGLRNAWTIDDGVRLSTSLERLSPLSAGSTSATAVTGALVFTQSPLWRGSVRAEYYAREGSDNLFGSVGYARKVAQDWTFLGNTVFSTMLDGDRAFERTRLGMAYRQTERNRWNALARYEHRYDENPDLAEGIASVRAAHVFATNLNYQPDPDIVFRAQWASKFAALDRSGRSSTENAHLVGGSGTLDVTEIVDIGLIGRALFSSASGTTQFGVGAEVGVLLADNLRLSGGYNLFGFRDEELSDNEYTDRGFYVQLGLKFDESLFGGPADRGVVDSLTCGCPPVPPGESDVVVTITPGPESFEFGQTGAYSVTTTNAGPDRADNVTLKVVLDPRFEVASVDDTRALTMGDSIMWALGALALHDTVVHEMSLRLRASCTPTDAALNIRAVGATSTTESDLTNNRDATLPGCLPDPVDPVGSVDLQVEVFGLDSAFVGDTISFDVTTRSNTPDVDAEGVGDSIRWSGPVTPDSIVRGLTQDDGQAVVPPMHTHTVWFAVPPLGTLDGDSLWVAANAWTTSREPDTTNNRHSKSTRILDRRPPNGEPSDPDLAIDISGPSQGVAGDALTYYVVTTFAGPGAVPATVDVTLPSGWTFVSGNRAPTPDGDLLRWEPILLTAADTLVDSFVVSCASGTRSIRAAVTPVPGEPDSTNNLDSTLATCGAPPYRDLSITVRDASEWAVDTPHVYEIATINNSVDTLEALISAEFPWINPDVSIVRWGNGARSGGLITWEGIELPPGGSVNDFVTVIVAAPRPCVYGRPARSLPVGPLSLRADVAPAPGELNTANNQAESQRRVVERLETTCPTDTTDVAVNFDDPDPLSVGRGETVRLDITTANADASVDANDVLLWVPMPNAARFVPDTASESPRYAGVSGVDPLGALRETIRWLPAGALVAGDSRSDRLTFVAPDRDTVFYVVANVSSQNPERRYDNNRDSVRITVSGETPGRDLIVRLDTLEVCGCDVTFRITTLLRGASANGVRLRVLLPPGIDEFEAPGTQRRGDTLFWNRQVALAAGDSLVDTLSVTFPTNSDTVAVTAVVSSSSFESNINNNRDMIVVIQDTIALGACCDSACILCLWPPSWWWLLLLIPLVLWLLYRRRRYGRVTAPPRLWTIFRQKEIRTVVSELRDPTNKTHTDIRRIHDRVGGAPGTIDWVITEELMYSYRDVRSWTQIYKLWEEAPPALQKQAKVRRLFAFVLNRDGRREDAEYELRKLIEEKGPDPHTCGILGRVQKDRWQDAYNCAIAGDCGDPEGESLPDNSSEVERARPDEVRYKEWARSLEGPDDGGRRTDTEGPAIGREPDPADVSRASKAEAKRLLEVAIATYRGGHEAGPDNPYPGLNALTLAQYLPDKPNWYPLLMDQVKAAARAWAPEFEYWLHATRAELAVLDRRPDEAWKHLKIALDRSSVVWEVETTVRNLNLIWRAWKEREGSTPEWLDDMIGRLSENVDTEAKEAEPSEEVEPEDAVETRFVTQTGKGPAGDIVSLCNPGQPWSPRLKADAIEDIDSGRVEYRVTSGGQRSPVQVVRPNEGDAYLRSSGDGTGANNLANLPDCDGDDDDIG